MSPKYDLLSSQLDRLTKSFVIQNDALREMNDRLDILRNRKVAIMSKGPEYLDFLRNERKKVEAKEAEDEYVAYLKSLYSK